LKQLKSYYEEFYIDRNIRKSPLPVLTKLSGILNRFNTSSSQVIFKALTPSQRLFDLGCGDGALAWKAKSKFQQVYGIDISENAIKQAIEKQEKRADKDFFTFQTYDADDGLPFEDSFFDAVTCIAVLEHTAHPPTLLKEIKRVLKIGGELVLLVPNDLWLPYRLQYLTGKVPASGYVDDLGMDWGHLHKFNKENILKLLTAVGFHVSNVTCSGIFANFRKKWLSLLAGDIIIKTTKK
jgi:2-polyprenyl-3-methyl-5-hydroxy-6-metoxy-1,4-benzoquinol methylase